MYVCVKSSYKSCWNWHLCLPSPHSFTLCPSPSWNVRFPKWSSQNLLPGQSDTITLQESASRLALLFALFQSTSHSVIYQRLTLLCPSPPPAWAKGLTFLFTTASPPLPNERLCRHVYSLSGESLTALHARHCSRCPWCFREQRFCLCEHSVSHWAGVRDNEHHEKALYTMCVCVCVYTYAYIYI